MFHSSLFPTFVYTEESYLQASFCHRVRLSLWGNSGKAQAMMSLTHHNAYLNEYFDLVQVQP